jgi:hypothetical protein
LARQNSGSALKAEHTAVFRDCCKGRIYNHLSGAGISLRPFCLQAFGMGEEIEAAKNFSASDDIP